MMCPFVDECVKEKCKFYLPENVSRNFCDFTRWREIALKYQDLARFLIEVAEK